MVHACSNVEVSLFRSFFNYFYVTRGSHISGGTFVFVSPLLVLLVGLPVRLTLLLLLLLLRLILLLLLRFLLLLILLCVVVLPAPASVFCIQGVQQRQPVPCFLTCSYSCCCCCWNFGCCCIVGTAIVANSTSACWWMGVALQLLASRVVCDPRTLMFGICSISGAALAALPIYIASTVVRFRLSFQYVTLYLSLRLSSYPSCTSWILFLTVYVAIFSSYAFTTGCCFDVSFVCCALSQRTSLSVTIYVPPGALHRLLFPTSQSASVCLIHVLSICLSRSLSPSLSLHVSHSTIILYVSIAYSSAPIWSSCFRCICDSELHQLESSQPPRICTGQPALCC